MTCHGVYAMVLRVLKANMSSIATCQEDWQRPGHGIGTIFWRFRKLKLELSFFPFGEAQQEYFQKEEKQPEKKQKVLVKRGLDPSDPSP